MFGMEHEPDLVNEQISNDTHDLGRRRRGGGGVFPLGGKLVYMPPLLTPSSPRHS